MTPNEAKFYPPLLWLMSGLCVATGVTLLILMMSALIGPFRFFGQNAEAAKGALGLWIRGAAARGPGPELERRLDAWRKAVPGGRSLLESNSLAWLSGADVKVVMVPDARDLGHEEAAQLRAYLEAGGSVILTGLVGVLAEGGERGSYELMESLLQVPRVVQVERAASSSVAASRRGPLSSALAPGERIPLVATPGMPAIDNPQAELRWAARTGPRRRGALEASKRLRIGRGRLVWLAMGPENAAETGAGRWHPMVRLLHAAIAWASGQPSLEVLAWPNAAPFAATVQLDRNEEQTPTSGPTPRDLERTIRAELAEAEATGDLAQLSLRGQALGESTATGLEAYVLRELRQRGAWLATPEEAAIWIRERSQIAATLRRIGPQRLLLSVTNHGAQPARSVALRLHLNRTATFASVDRTILQQEAPEVRFRPAEQQLDLILPELPAGASSAYMINYESPDPLRADGAAAAPSLAMVRTDPGSLEAGSQSSAAFGRGDGP